MAPGPGCGGLTRVHSFVCLGPSCGLSWGFQLGEPVLHDTTLGAETPTDTHHPHSLADADPGLSENLGQPDKQEVYPENSLPSPGRVAMGEAPFKIEEHFATWHTSSHPQGDPR